MTNPTVTIGPCDHKSRTLRLRVWIDSDYVVHAADLPGCVSQGESIADCLVQIEEAFRGYVAACDDGGAAIPWEVGGRRPDFHEERFLYLGFEAADD